ncbi:MAG: restriction endonuclease subunit S [Gloeocapsa sp. DLM2.Bin57]|nr:MAG: restriction endonuclease subunit S [Gloeocapsa sp. DLM2.Bin57]
MNDSWIYTTLGEAITLQRGFDLPAKDRKLGNIPVVASTGIVGTHNQARVKAPGVVIGRSGSLGFAQFIEKDFWALNTTLWVKDFKGNNPKFIYYLLSYLDLGKYNVGSGVPTLNRNHIHPLEIYLPPLAEQKAIAHILGTLDDKIELNQRMNRTLESIARAIFKSWFIDFDPVRAKMEGRDPVGMSKEIADLFPDSFVDSELGMIPKGWEVKSADKIFNISIGKTPPRKESHWFSTSYHNIRWVSIRDMGENGLFITDTNEYLIPEAVEKFNIKIVPNHTVILSFKLTIGRLAITDGEMVTNEAIAHFNIEDRKKISSEYTYLYLSFFDYSLLGNTSSIAQAINSKIIKKIPILIPSNNLIHFFTSKVNTIFTKINTNQRESKKIAYLRDTLLPKLISGEIRIKEAEKIREKEI